MYNCIKNYKKICMIKLTIFINHLFAHELVFLQMNWACSRRVG